MTKKQKASRPANKTSNQVVETIRSGSGTRTLHRSGSARTVTPTSERIITETSVKRRSALKVLANR